MKVFLGDTLKSSIWRSLILVFRYKQHATQWPAAMFLLKLMENHYGRASM